MLLDAAIILYLRSQAIRAAKPLTAAVTIADALESPNL
jgi:hypothetical protein